MWGGGLCRSRREWGRGAMQRAWSGGHERQQGTWHPGEGAAVAVREVAGGGGGKRHQIEWRGEGEGSIRAIGIDVVGWKVMQCAEGGLLPMGICPFLLT